MKPEGRARLGPIRFEWGESIKRLQREAVLQFGGDRFGLGPIPYLRIRVGNEPHKWRPPHNTSIRIEFGRNRTWIIEVHALGKQYIEEKHGTQDSVRPRP